MSQSYIVGADIGGTHITTAVVDMNNCHVVNHTRKRTELNSSGDPDNILDTWAASIRHSLDAFGYPIPLKLGIAMPGPCDYEEGICLIRDQNKYEALYNRNLKEELARRFSTDSGEIKMINDAAAFLQGEIAGELKGKYDKALGFTLGTGFGSAVYENKRVTDANLWCAPFRDGIAEDYLSSRWLTNRFFELSGQRVRNVKQLVNVHAASPYLQQVRDEYIQQMTAFLAPLVHEMNPGIVILGGNVCKAFSQLDCLLSKALDSIQIHSVIRLSRHGEDSALIGAASYRFESEIHINA